MKSLMNLARLQGSMGGSVETRGACKLCGGLGHLTKQCHNFLSGHAGPGADLDAPVLVPLGLLPPEPGELSGLDSSDLSDSGTDSAEERKRKRKEKKSKKSKKVGGGELHFCWCVMVAGNMHTHPPATLPPTTPEPPHTSPCLLNPPAGEEGKEQE